MATPRLARAHSRAATPLQKAASMSRFYRLPVPPFMSLDNDRHQVDWQDGIDLRVAWTGAPGDAGLFEMRQSGVWTALQHATPDVVNEQMRASGGHDIARVRLVRESSSADARFAARAIAIDWLDMPASDDVLVERDVHYRYADDNVPEWVHSKVDGAVHRVELAELVVGRDYELWVRLWHPGGTGATRDMDPIVRTVGGGGPSET